MALKLSKSSAGAAPAGGTGRQKNPTLAVGIILAIVVAIAVAVGYSGLQAKETVLVAKNTIPPYSSVSKSMFAEVKVPKNSVTEYDLTPSSFDENFNNGQIPVTRTEILQNQRVDVRSLLASSTGALATVKQDEVVIAISTTVTGIVGGAVVPGSVVDVIPTGQGGLSGVEDLPDGSGEVGIADNVKVLGVGAGSSASQGFVKSTQTKEEKNATNNDNTIIVVLAVPKTDAAGILGTSNPVLALNPHLGFDRKGDLCPVSKCNQVNDKQDPDAPPGDGTTVPGDGTTVPGDGTTVPGDGTTVPGDGTTVPGDETTNPPGAKTQGG